MSSTEEKPELKGNHAPAEKVGGVRIVRKERKSESEKPGSNEEFEDGEESSSTAVASQTLAKQMQESYPEEAVRAFHEKPMPQHQQHTKNATHNTQKHELFQPRKQ